MAAHIFIIRSKNL